MKKIEVEVTVVTRTSDGRVLEANQAFVQELDRPFAPEWLQKQLFRKCEKELLVGKYRLPLPDPTDLTTATKNFPGPPSPDEFAAWENTGKVWLEIENAFLEVEHLISNALAYRDLEPRSDDPNEWITPHLNKLHALNEAAIRLTKVEDLFLLLLFVNSGATLLEIDVTKPNWQKGLSVRRIQKRLELRKKSSPQQSQLESLAYLDALTDEEYAALLDVFSKFFNNASAAVVRGYRDKIAHRLQPSVDHPDLYSDLDFPVKSGRGTVYTLKVKCSVDYTSESLYDDMRLAINHYLELLRKLKSSVARLDG